MNPTLATIFRGLLNKVLAINAAGDVNYEVHLFFT